MTGHRLDAMWGGTEDVGRGGPLIIQARWEIFLKSSIAASACA
jgi:hypothetical protein